MAKTVSNQLVEMLIDAGVKRVYAITGDSLNPVNSAIREDGRLEWIHVRHEEAAAYAASMDAELNGIGCCMGSSGPGHVHLINGLYDANRAGNPVIAIASTCPTSKFGQEYFQETNPFYLFQDCSKYVYVANTPTQAPHMMHAAIMAAKNRKGVAVVGLPGDVAAAEAQDIITSTKVNETKSVLRPNDKELEKLAQVLNENDKITLYCGRGCADAQREVLMLAEKLQSPIGYSFRGKIYFDKEDNQFRAGLNGLLGHKSGYDACNKCEVLVLLGTDFPYAEFLPQDKKIIQIDTNASILGRRAKVDLGLVGDIKDTIKALLPMIVQKENNEFLASIQQLYKDSKKAVGAYVTPKSEKNKIHPEYVAHLLDKLTDDDAIFAVDTGMCSVWAARFIGGAKNRYLTGSFNHGSMANALPMAIGAACSTKNRQVIAMCGDGGLSMLLGDLATIMQYNLPIKMIVFNNRSLGMVRLEMQVAGLVDWQTDMDNPKFEVIAESMGIKNDVIRETSNLEKKLQQILSTEGPALVNIYTDPNALAMPPHITLEQIKGFTASGLKMIGQRKFDELEDVVKSNYKHLYEIF